MSEQSKAIEFVAFCIEAFAKHKHISGAEACAVFERFGALGYRLADQYLFHTEAALSFLSFRCAEEVRR